MSNQRFKKFIGIFDLHYPHNIDLSGIEKFMKDFKPDTIVYGGDIWDCEPLSHWGEENRFKEIGLENIRLELNKQAKGLYDLIARQIKLCNAKDVHYLIGNHEHWIAMYQAKYGTVAEPMTFESLTKIKDLGVKVHEQGKAIKVGKIYFVHGDKIAKSAGNVAKTGVTWYQSPVFFGHYHTTQSYGNVSPVEVESPQVGHCIGCLTSNNPDYNKNKPNACVNQFVFGYIDTKTGQFTYYTPIIVRGKFIWNERYY